MGKKKSFLVYFDWRESLELLTDAEIGAIFRALFRFAEKGELPDFESRVLMVVFNSLKGHISRDLEKYEEICKKKAEAGRLGGLQKAENMRSANET